MPDKRSAPDRQHPSGAAAYCYILHNKENLPSRVFSIPFFMISVYLSPVKES